MALVKKTILNNQHRIITLSVCEQRNSCVSTTATAQRMQISIEKYQTFPHISHSLPAHWTNMIAPFVAKHSRIFECRSNTCKNPSNYYYYYCGCCCSCAGVCVCSECLSARLITCGYACVRNVSVSGNFIYLFNKNIVEYKWILRAGVRLVGLSLI